MTYFLKKQIKEGLSFKGPITSSQSSLSLGKWGEAQWWAPLEQGPGMACVYILPAASSHQITNQSSKSKPVPAVIIDEACTQMEK